jgi:iron complex transport system ATP-binding protein
MSRAELSLNGIGFAYEGSGWGMSIPRLCLGQERVTSIVGPNGSGKSTLLRIAAGILPPSAGTVELNGQPLSAMHRRRIARRIGFLPQESPPLFDYSVEEVVRMGRYAHLRGIGILTERDNRAVDRALAAVDMAAFRERPLSRLSGGERRRALIASVLAQEPDILLLDEPTNSLDIHHAGAVMRLLWEFGNGSPSVVIVTHDVNLASLFSERLILLVGGEACADGRPEDVVRPEVMSMAYGSEVLIREHPETGGPMILSRRHSAARWSPRNG